MARSQTPVSTSPPEALAGAAIDELERAARWGRPAILDAETARALAWHCAAREAELAQLRGLVAMLARER